MPSGDVAARSRPLDTAAAALGALVVALALDAVGVPAGLIVGGMIGAAAVSIGRDVEISLPGGLVTALQVVVGIVIGVSVTSDVLRRMGALLGPALLAAVLIITAGLLVAHLLHRLGALPSWAVLATCPGALEALVLIAAERDEGAVEVALFHIVRVVVVLLSVPVLLLLVGR